MTDLTGVVDAVADFGAIPNGTDTGQLQAALDACFGPASNPNGIQSWRNKKLWIPPGRYQLSAPLILTKVQGGAIQGLREAGWICITAGVIGTTAVLVPI